MPLIPKIPRNNKMYNKKITVCKSLLCGYRIFCDYLHPLVNKSNGTVYLHRHIMSIIIGRWIENDEHVHHIDGNILNNQKSNLVLLTRSEHTKLHMGEITYYKFICKYCNKEYISQYKNSTFCSPKCSSCGRKKFNITKEELAKLVWSMPMREAGKLLKVDGNSIKKRCIKLGVQWPPMGYWNSHKYNK